MAGPQGVWGAFSLPGSCRWDRPQGAHGTAMIISLAKQCSGNGAGGVQARRMSGRVGPQTFCGVCGQTKCALARESVRRPGVGPSPSPHHPQGPRMPPKRHGHPPAQRMGAESCLGGRPSASAISAAQAKARSAKSICERLPGPKSVLFYSRKAKQILQCFVPGAALLPLRS